MPRTLTRSGNKVWYVTEKTYPGDPASERGLLVSLIQRVPGITTGGLTLTVEQGSRVPSRLVELEREGYIRSSFEQDLFR